MSTRRVLELQAKIDGLYQELYGRYRPHESFGIALKILMLNEKVKEIQYNCTHNQSHSNPLGERGTDDYKRWVHTCNMCLKTWIEEPKEELPSESTN